MVVVAVAPSYITWTNKHPPHTHTQVALAFKLEEGRFGQLTYLRLYSGTLRKGDNIINMSSGKKLKVPRLVRMHSDELEDIPEAGAGDIVAMFGAECASGDTFTDGNSQLAMTSIMVPEPVMSLAITPKSREASAAFSKALNRFTREDPTFKVSVDKDSGQTIISGMGELHLDIYVERMKREYNVDCEVGKPRVNFREALTARGAFDYLHKKQSGGQGQYGRVVGYLEPIDEEECPGETFQFENAIIGNAIPPSFVPACEKGFKEAANAGLLIGHPVENMRCGVVGVGGGGMCMVVCCVRCMVCCGVCAYGVVMRCMVLLYTKCCCCIHGVATVHHRQPPTPHKNNRAVITDGATHPVDSSELAFKIACLNAFRQAYEKCRPVILEPIMEVEVRAPTEFQGTVVGDLNRRKGIIVNSEQEMDDVVIVAEVPLNDMFGYSTILRSMTQGKGEFSMEYKRHAPVSPDVQRELVAAASRSGKT